MTKTLKQVIRQDREPVRIPRSVQEALPTRKVWADGTFLVGNSKYSRTYRFTDINYLAASKEDQTEMFLDFCELLNSLEVGATSKETIFNRRINMQQFARQNLYPLRGNALDPYREDENRELMEKAMSGSGIRQEKFFTVSVVRNSYEEAKTFFARVSAELGARFAKLSSRCTELDLSERMRIFHDFFRTGEEDQFRFSLKELMRKGHSFADSICPSGLSFAADYIRIGKKYARVLYLEEYPSYIKDTLISELTELNRTLMLSVDIIPVPTDEAVREVENRLLGTETDITKWQRKQNQNNNFSAVVPYDLEQQRRESKEFLDDLTTRDQRMMFVVVTLVHTADTKKQLDTDTESLLAVARKHICKFDTLRYQQMAGLNTVLPYGLRKIDALRTLTTESTAALMPFRAQEIRHRDGIYCGQNAISRNLIFVNREELLNGNGFILGVSGSGKSFFAKREILELALREDCDVLVIDPEAEYGSLIRSLGGEVIRISADSPNHINALDMTPDYGDTENPVVLKSEFVLSLCEQLAGAGKLGPKEKSLIDRCTALVYQPYIRNGFRGLPPTLKEFYAELLRQPEPEARDVALSIELFTNGSLNTFARQTNVDTENALVCYDIMELGKALKTVGMLVVMDSIYNRIIRNRRRRRPTYVFLDELYLLFANEYSSNFLFEQWKRARKYSAFYTGISQNIEDMLQSHTARTMLANSEFIVMLNQAATDRIELAKLLGISETQLSYVTNSEAGEGLLKCAGSIVPFVDRSSPHSLTYPLLTTKPRDGWNGEGTGPAAG